MDAQGARTISGVTVVRFAVLPVFLAIVALAVTGSLAGWWADLSASAVQAAVLTLLFGGAVGGAYLAAQGRLPFHLRIMAAVAAVFLTVLGAAHLIPGVLATVGEGRFLLMAEAAALVTVLVLVGRRLPVPLRLFLLGLLSFCLALLAAGL